MYVSQFLFPGGRGWNVSFTIQFREQSNQLHIWNRIFEHFEPCLINHKHTDATDFYSTSLGEPGRHIDSSTVVIATRVTCVLYIATTVVTGIRKYPSSTVTYNNHNTDLLWYEPQQDVYVRTSHSDWSLSCLFSAPPNNFRDRKFCYGSRDSSVSTVSVLPPADAKNFSSNLCFQTGYGAHTNPCTVCTGGPFPEVKARQGRGADYSPPSSAEVMDVYKLYHFSPLRLLRCTVDQLWVLL
jgi:hypothetical protein